MVLQDSESASSSSFLCSCCLGSKKRKSNAPESQLFQPTMVYSNKSPDTVPEIVISSPTTVAPLTSRSDIFMTARTSRPEESDNYHSMAELVHQIRNEAGLNSTPRINEEDETEFQVITVSQLRIEGLAELHNNNEEPPFPSVSCEYYPTQIETSKSRNSESEVSEKNSNIFNENQGSSLEPCRDTLDTLGPLSQALQSCNSPPKSRINDVTFSIYSNLWKAYSIVVAFIVLFFERILPL